jgi:hypothetical protein
MFIDLVLEFECLILELEIIVSIFLTALDF